VVGLGIDVAAGLWVGTLERRLASLAALRPAAKKKAGAW